MKNTKRKDKNTQNQIKILSQTYLGPKKSLAVVRVAGESMLVGITEGQINLIKSLSLLDEDIPEYTPEHFGPTMKKSLYQHQDAELDQEDDEDFKFRGIKDVVSRKIRDMKGFGG